MPMYLAKIDKRVARRDKLILLMHNRFNNSWVKVVPSQSVTLDRQYSNLQEGDLVLAEVEQDKVIKIEDAVPTITEALQNLSLRVLNFSKQESAIKLWRESLELQASQLFARTEDIERREELLKIREVKVKNLLQKLGVGE